MGNMLTFASRDETTDRIAKTAQGGPTLDPYRLLALLRPAQLLPIIDMPLLLDCFEIRDSRLHGKGVFATKDIPSGSLIMAERAAWTIPKMWLLKMYPFDPDGKGPHLIVQHFNACVANMTDDDDGINQEAAEAVFALDGGFRGIENPMIDLSELDLARGLARIVAKNAKSHHFKSSERRFVAIFLEPSRLNHSCMLSAEQHLWQFNDGPRTDTYTQIRAARDIKTGEEITLQYTRPFDTTEIREAYLGFHDIVCSCTLCMGGKNRVLRSDKRREKIQQAWDVMQVDFTRLTAAIERPPLLKTQKAMLEREEYMRDAGEAIMKSMNEIDSRLRPEDQVGNFMMWHLLQTFCEALRFGTQDNRLIVASIERFLALGESFKELHAGVTAAYEAQLALLQRKIASEGA
ncbi:SET domain-containing protein 5 [Oleoguttula sp. CCFEE 5521]